MASDSAALVAEARRDWHELVRGGALTEDDPGLERVRSVLIYGDRRVCGVVRPNFVTRDRFEAERLACRLVASALSKVAGAAQADPGMLEELGIRGAERELIAIDPGYAEFDVVDRFDAFMSKRLGFVEVQGAIPGAIGYHDELAHAFAETAVYERFAERFELEPLEVVPRQRAALLDTWQAWGGEGDPVVAIVDWKDAPLMPEFELIRDDLLDNDIEAFICDPRDLRFEGGKLRAGEREVGLLYRRLTIIDVVERPEDTRAIVDAARAGAVCVVNPFASDLMGHKSIFDLMTDERRDFGLTAAERNAVRNHVPSTRPLVPEHDRSGVTISATEACECRCELVLKPTHEYGGRGVSLGWETDPETWAALVEEAVGNDWVAQRRIATHHEAFPLDAPGFPLREFFIDSDPYMFRGRMGGILTRLSADELTNVTQGGGLVPTFVLEPH